MNIDTRQTLQVEGFFDATTRAVSYIVLDRTTRQCALVDCVLDGEPTSGSISHAGADRLLARACGLRATVQWILETRAHADRLSAAPYLMQVLGGALRDGPHVTTVRRMYGDLFGAGSGCAPDRRQRDHPFADGEAFAIGSLRARAMHTPGHSPACMSYVVSDAVQTAAFIGDTLRTPDDGAARCDVSARHARALYGSIHKVLSLPPETVLYLGHDARRGGREVQFPSSVAEQRAQCARHVF